MNHNLLCIFVATVSLSTSFSQGHAQERAADRQKPIFPSTATHPVVGQSDEMVWSSFGDRDDPALSFAVPETDNRLWLMRCARQENGNVRIMHQLEAQSAKMGAGDQFGFTIRVDENPSIGMIGQMRLSNGEGGAYYAPKFYTGNRHRLFGALARGKRAYFNMNGDKFSIHLKGSGDALKQFLQACR